MDLQKYACNMHGTAQLALDLWQDSKAQHDAMVVGDTVDCEAERMILTGRCGALSRILEHITGVPSSRADEWQSSINAITK